MKTFILRLEPHDDLTSVRDKLGWAKNSRILIVWPERGELLNRRIDLVLIQRFSQSLGSQLALVSQDPEICYQAPRLGIPVFKSLRSAQNEHWRLPHRFRKTRKIEPFPNRLEDRPGRRGIPERPTPPDHRLSPLARLGFFSAGVLALLAIAAVLVPSADLFITPQTVVQDVLIEAYTAPEIQQMNISGALPSETVTVVVEGRLAQPVSGVIRLPDRAAEGSVVFTNLTDQPLEIPEGTVVRAVSGSGAAAAEPALRYATTRAVILDAGPGESASIRVRCLTPGKAGDLPAESINAVEGILGTQVSVHNPDPIQGGSDRVEPAPNDADRKRLSDELHASLRETALAELEKGLNPGDLLIAASLELVEVLEENFQPQSQQPADQLILHRRLEFKAGVVRFDDQQRLVEAVFNANLPSGFTALPETLHLEVVGAPESGEDRSATWKLHAVRYLQAQISDSQAVQLSLGLPKAQAAERLQDSLALEEPPQIRLLPDWWPRLPVLPFRIQIHNQSPHFLALQKQGGS